MRRILFCWGGVAFLLFPCGARALEWKSQIISARTEPFQSAHSVVFEFRNNSLKPVTITEVETSCGCLEANADRKTYAPGASGKIDARMAIGDRFGDYERFIYVHTDESAEPVRLAVRLDVPEVATATPRSLAWKVHAAADEKSVDVEPAAGLEVEFTEAEPTSEEFSVRLETVQAGHRYRVVVKPASTAQPANAAIRIYGHDKNGHAVLVSAYVNIQ